MREDDHPTDGLPPTGAPEAAEGAAADAAATRSRTSDDAPYEVAWLKLRHAPGRLGVAMAPGRRDRTADAVWRRDLHADLRRLRHVHRVQTLVSLLPADEREALGIDDLPEAAGVHGLEFLTLGVVDGSVPTAAQEDEVMALVRTVARRVEDGGAVVVHCRAGQGRSGTLAAIVAAVLGETPPAAIALVRRVQPRAVETVAQEAYVGEALTAWSRRRMADR